MGDISWWAVPPIERERQHLERTMADTRGILEVATALQTLLTTALQTLLTTALQRSTYGSTDETFIKARRRADQVVDLITEELGAAERQLATWPPHPRKCLNHLCLNVVEHGRGSYCTACFDRMAAELTAEYHTSTGAAP